MRRHRVVPFLCILLVLGCRQQNRKPALEVTYIANEGFMIVMGNTKLLIDALPNSKYYANPSDTTAAKMINGIPPFDDINYALVTHHHPDHFNAALMSRFLLNHPAAQLIASSATCSTLTGDGFAGRRFSGLDLSKGQQRTIRGDNAEIVVMRLDHGGGSEISNLAYIVRSNGYTIAHVGDARLSANEEYLRAFDWSSHGVDLLFLEYFDRSSETQGIVQDIIKPKHVILMHIPAGEEENVRKGNERIHPRTVVFGKENETRRFDNSAEDESPH